MEFRALNRDFDGISSNAGQPESQLNLLDIMKNEPENQPSGFWSWLMGEQEAKPPSKIDASSGLLPDHPVKNVLLEFVKGVERGELDQRQLGKLIKTYAKSFPDDATRFDPAMMKVSRDTAKFADAVQKQLGYSIELRPEGIKISDTNQNPQTSIVLDSDGQVFAFRQADAPYFNQSPQSIPLDVALAKLSK